MTDPLFAEGLTRMAARDYLAAADYLAEAAAKHPTDPAAFHALGLALSCTDDLEGATIALGKAALLSPSDLDIWMALADVAARADHWHVCLNALEHLPANNPDVMADRALALVRLRRFDEAESLARPLTTPSAINALGLALDGQNRLEEAAALFTQLGEDPQALSNLGWVLRRSGRLADAIDCYERALRLDPNNATTHFNLANTLLLDGRYEAGWAEYEWRPKAALAQPLWDGTPWGQKTLLVMAEQGYGDSLTMVRFLPRLATMGKVIVAVPQALGTLLKTNFPNITIIENGQSLPPFDLYCPMMSLPHRLHLTAKDIVGTPYLTADPHRRTSWHQRFAGIKGRKIGLVWQGNPTQSNDANRSMPPDFLAPLWDIPDVGWINFQVGSDFAFPGFDATPWLTDFAETAAALSEIDLLISVDTAPMHLAGALGQPVLALLCHAPDWRYRLGNDRCDWYDTVRLLRQPSPGDWAATIAQVAGYLGGATGQG